MLAPVLTMQSTMRLRTMSTNTFFRPALTSEPARQRMMPQSLVGQHAVVNVGRPGQVAGRKGHVVHGLDQRHDVVPRDVDVLDGLRQQFFLVQHGQNTSIQGGPRFAKNSR